VFIIRITSTALILNFGIFTWRVSLDNSHSCKIDELPPFDRYGSAGIHFMTVYGRYRATLNSQEYSRLVIALKRKAGLVKDVSFPNQKPEDILEIIDKAIHVDQATPKRHSPRGYIIL
jgi:hypothetical protein